MKFKNEQQSDLRTLLEHVYFLLLSFKSVKKRDGISTDKTKKKQTRERLQYIPEVLILIKIFAAHSAHAHNCFDYLLHQKMNVGRALLILGKKWNSLLPKVHSCRFAHKSINTHTHTPLT